MCGLLPRHRNPKAFVGVDVVVVLNVLAQIDLHPVDLAVAPAGVGGVVGLTVVPDSFPTSVVSSAEEMKPWVGRRGPCRFPCRRNRA